MARRRKTKEIENLYPKQDCHKCGRNIWYTEATALTWACAMCGNRIYYSYGVLKQQIDIVMQSGRGGEYVYSQDRKSILPKKNDGIRKMKFAEKIKKASKK